MAKWITAEIERASDEELSVQFNLAGDLGNLALPEYHKPGRADGLWRTTCFELFLSDDSNGSYFEFNLSPSTQWAAYRFAAYRERMTDLTLALPPRLRLLRAKEGLSLIASISDLPPASLWKIGLSAVVEDLEGNLAYWALRHPPGPPDFHHPDGFVLELPPPG